MLDTIARARERLEMGHPIVNLLQENAMSMAEKTTILYRPIGEDELALIGKNIVGKIAVIAAFHSNAE